MRILFKLPFGVIFVNAWRCVVNYGRWQSSCMCSTVHLHSVFEVVKLILVWHIALTMLGPGLPYFPDPLWKQKKYTNAVNGDTVYWMMWQSQQWPHWILISQANNKGGRWLDHSQNKQIMKPLVQPSNNTDDALCVWETESNTHDFIFKKITSVCWGEEHVERVEHLLKKVCGDTHF